MRTDEIYKAVKQLRENQRPKEYCPKCGKEVIMMSMNPEALQDMIDAGYDGTCCWPGFDEMAKP